MRYWIFKVAKQKQYFDVEGKEYIFDNTHSVKLKPGDTFIYLDKRNRDYAFTGTGSIQKLKERAPSSEEKRRDPRVRTVYQAIITDMLWFRSPLSIFLAKIEGRRNRSRLGISNINLLGWSQSMPNIDESIYSNIMDLVLDQNLIPDLHSAYLDYTVEDSWSKSRIRNKMARFTHEVKERHNYTCAICGTEFKPALVAAHLSPYATDKKNRANPRNGICLCTFCHSALDKNQICLRSSGEILINSLIDDDIAKIHFTGIPPEMRKKWLMGIDDKYLKLTEELYSRHINS